MRLPATLILIVSLPSFMQNTTIMIGILALGACSDGGPAVCSRDGGAACFELPTRPMRWYVNGGDSGPAVIGCGEIAPVPSAMAVALQGRVTNWDTAVRVAGVTLEVFDAGDYASPIATATTDGNGAYSMSLASGTPDRLWGTIRGGGSEPQLIHQMRPDLSQATVMVDYAIATPATLDRVIAELPGVGVDRDAGRAQLAVYVLDCGGRAIMETAVVLSTTAGRRNFVDGVPVFYSAVGLEFPLPGPHEEIGVTENDGVAVLLNVPVDGAPLYVQAWGFPDEAAVARGQDGLVLIAEHAPTRRAGWGTRVNLWANQD